MESGIRRLFRLAATLDRLRETYAARLVENAAKRQALLQRRASLEALLAADTRFLDLTTGGGLKRLREIAAELHVLSVADDKLKRRSADAFLKAKRARATAAMRRFETSRLEARKDLASLADGLSHARLRQVKDR